MPIQYKARPFFYTVKSIITTPFRWSSIKTGTFLFSLAYHQTFCDVFGIDKLSYTTPKAVIKVEILVFQAEKLFEIFR